MDHVGDLLRATSAPLPPPALLGTLAVAVVSVLWSPVWRTTRHVVTIAHEAAHGLAARAVGRRLTGIRLHSDTSGLTVSRGRPTGPGMVATLAAGYPGPSLVGLGAALVLRAGYAAALLCSMVVLLALMLLKIRNWYGLWSVLVCGAAVVAVTWWTSPQTQSAFAHTVTWFLLLAGPRAVVELHRGRRGGRDRASDADQLGRLTGIPAVVWVGLFALVTLGALAAGTVVLIP